MVRVTSHYPSSDEGHLPKYTMGEVDQTPKPQGCRQTGGTLVMGWENLRFLA